jgi:DNA processing protein
VVPSFYPIVALLLTEGVRPADCFSLPPDAALAFTRLQTADGRRKLSFAIRRPVGDVPWDRFDAQIEAIDRLGAGVVTHLDACYPRVLRDIGESPAILFYRGDLERLHERGVAIVGCRRSSARGAAFTRRLAGDAAGMGIPVVSGAALGIDTAAHRGALDAGGDTVAVLGAGLDVPYPESNERLLDEIAVKGCVVTEQLMGTPPLKYVFPRRNRLISAFSHAVIVVEAGERSGALITAKWALEQGRDVGAVPGFPGDARSRGSNALIKSGAFTVESIDDILAAVPRIGVARDHPTLRPGVSGQVASGKRESAAEGRAEAPGESELESLSGDSGLTIEASLVLDALGSSPVDVDAIARHMDMSAAAVLRSLLDLELRGFVEREASGLYYRKRS